MDKAYQYQQQQQLNNEQPSPPPPPSSKLFSLSHKHLAILVVIMCLTSLGSAIYFLTLHNKKDTILTDLFKQRVLFFPLLKPTPQEPPKKVDITSDWNIYSNSEFGYSIKYPIDWRATITSQEDPKILEYVVFNPLETTKAGELSITLTYTTRSYKEILDADPQPGEAITVASVSATRKLKQDSQKNVSISVALSHNSNTFSLLGKEKYKDTFDQMLSTLNLAP